MKSTLEVRPVFHWTEDRIKGHLIICFLSFLPERTVEFKLKEAQEKASPEEIREALNSLNFAEVEIENQQFLLKIKGTELGNQILKLLKISLLKKNYPCKLLKAIQCSGKIAYSNLKNIDLARVSAE